MTDTQRFRLNISVEYEAEIFEDDPNDVSRLTAVENAELYNKIAQLLDNHVFDWDEETLSVELQPL